MYFRLACCCALKSKKTLSQKYLDSIEVQYFVSSTISSASVFWYSFAYRKGITKLRQFRFRTFIKTINKLLGLHDFKNIYTTWTWLRWRRNSSFNRFNLGQGIYVHYKYEFPAHKGSENLTFQLRKQLQLLDCGFRLPVSTRLFTSHFVNIGKFYLESKIFEFCRLKLGFL